MSNPVHGRPPNNSGLAGSSTSSSSSSSSSLSTTLSPSASSPVSVNVQQPAGNSSLTSGGSLKEKVGLPPVYLNLNEHAGKESATPQVSCSPLQHWDDTRTADVWLSSLHSVIFIITCALAAFILFRNVLTW